MTALEEAEAVVETQEGPTLPFGYSDEQRAGTGWMIIWTDGLNRDSVEDYVVALNMRNEYTAKLLEKALQESVTDDGDWYIAVPHDYELKRGMWDLI